MAWKRSGVQFSLAPRPEIGLLVRISAKTSFGEGGRDSVEVAELIAKDNQMTSGPSHSNPQSPSRSDWEIAKAESITAYSAASLTMRIALGEEPPEDLFNVWWPDLDLTEENKNQVGFYSLPCFLTLAYSIEVGLKAIGLHDVKTVGGMWGHDLGQMYAALDQGTQSALSALFDPTNNQRFENVIIRTAAPFVEARYAFDRSKPGLDQNKELWLAADTIQQYLRAKVT